MLVAVEILVGVAVGAWVGVRVAVALGPEVRVGWLLLITPTVR